MENPTSQIKEIKKMSELGWYFVGMYFVVAFSFYYLFNKIDALKEALRK